MVGYGHILDGEMSALGSFMPLVHAPLARPLLSRNNIVYTKKSDEKEDRVKMEGDTFSTVSLGFKKRTGKRTGVLQV